jgi:hypothetical protein
MSRTELDETTGGWVEIHGEKRFVPLGKKRIAHCSSCLHFRKGTNPYCKLQPDTFLEADTEACEGYINRTWGNG